MTRRLADKSATTQAIILSICTLAIFLAVLGAANTIAEAIERHAQETTQAMCEGGMQPYHRQQVLPRTYEYDQGDRYTAKR